MRLPDFEYFESRSVAEACSLLAEDPENSALFAGGTDMLIRMSQYLVRDVDADVPVSAGVVWQDRQKAVKVGKVGGEAGGLATVLHEAVNDPDAPRLEIVYEDVKPDLLQHEAQAILRGQLGEDGRFYADELLLKCPTRYEEEIPDQVETP